MGCHALFKAIFPILGSNPCLLHFLHCKWTLYPLSYLRSPIGWLKEDNLAKFYAKSSFFSYLLNYTAQKPIWSENTGLSKRLRLNYDSCHISMQLKKKLIKTDFSCSHFNNEDGRKKQLFWHITLYYFKKGKNATEKLKEERFVQCMEKVLWLIEHVTSGWWSFVLELSRWMMLHGQVDQLKLTEVKSVRTSRTINVIPCAREADILKIPKSSVENHLQQHGYVHLFDVWVPHKLIKKILTIFPHGILYLTVPKMLVFKTNCNRQCKVDTSQ